jgi:hypothetical protein
MLILLLLTALQTTTPLAEALSGIDNVLSERELAKLSRNPAADLAALARDSNERAHVRARATQSLSRFADENTQLTVAGLTTDPVARVRLAATKVVARWACRPQMGLSQAVLTAMDRALTGTDLAVQLQAIRAFGAVNNSVYPGARQRLLDLYRASTSEPLRHAIAAALTIDRE